VIVPGFAEEVAAVVAEAGCGIAVDTADAAAVARAVAALADPATRAALGARGRQAALTRFGWDAEAARLVALYAALLASARSHTTTAEAPASGVPTARAPR
jgi:glycosyltransferase involved in cell wall biosynthesis